MTPAKKSDERTIEGSVVRVIQHTGRSGLHLARRLAGLMGVGFTDVGKILGELGGMSESDFNALVNDVLARTTIDGTPAVEQFDVIFQGRLDFLFSVVAFALEVNFARFFVGLRAKLGPQKAASPSETPATSAATG